MTPLSQRMYDLAADHERAVELCAEADKFNKLTEDPTASTGAQLKQWAKCNRLMKECTGEDPLASKIATDAATLAHALQSFRRMHNK